MKCTLPDDEATLIERLKTEGQLILAGKEWFLDEAGRLHYRTIPTLDGQQLSLKLDVPYPSDSLFAQGR